MPVTDNGTITTVGQLQIGAGVGSLIVNAAQAGARTYTIPDAGASASFIMTKGAQTFAAIQTFTLGITLTTTAPLTMGEGGNVVVGTSTGTKVGSTAAQKLGFWGVTPVVQPAGASQAELVDSTGGTADGTLVDVETATLADPAKINANFADVVVLVNALRTALVTAGIIKGAV